MKTNPKQNQSVNTKSNIMEKKNLNKKADKFFTKMKKSIEAEEINCSSGEYKALYAWKYSKEDNLSTLELRDFLWDREVEAFVSILRRANIKKFIYTNQSTALMSNLHTFESFGCKILGLTKRRERIYGDEYKDVLGIIIKL